MKYGYLQDGTKIEPGDGWEIVPEGTPQDGDMEFFAESAKRWIENPCGLGNPATNVGGVLAYRRKTISDGWKKVGEGDRQTGKAILVWRNMGFETQPHFEIQLWNSKEGYTDASLTSSRITHWRYAEGFLPEPPKPEVKPEEMAFEEWFTDEGFIPPTKEIIKKAYLAGYAKGQSK